jgi:hypothetical protein
MPGYFDVVFTTQASLHPDGEPSDYISAHDGVIRYEREKDGRLFRVGRVRAHRIHAGLAANRGESLFDVCDSHSGDLLDVYAHLYEPGGSGFKDELATRYSAVESDCLVLDYVVLHPKWRGLRLGLLAARKAVDLLGGGCGLCACYVSPLSPEAAEELRVPASWLPRHDTEEARRAATVKLRRYAREMGFVRLGKTDYYVLPLNHVSPSPEDLLKGQPEQDE